MELRHVIGFVVLFNILAVVFMFFGTSFIYDPSVTQIQQAVDTTQTEQQNFEYEQSNMQIQQIDQIQGNESESQVQESIQQPTSSQSSEPFLPYIEEKPVYEPADDDPDWKRSDPWYEYISRMTRYPTMNLQIDKQYCYKRMQNSTPWDQTKGIKILTEYPRQHFINDVLRKYGFNMIVVPSHIMSSTKKLQYIMPNVDFIMYHDRTIHEKLLIDSEFACRDQRYNHIPGNHYMNYKDEMARVSREYSQKVGNECYNHNKHVPPTYITQIPEDCSAIADIFKTYATQSEDSLKWMGKLARNVHSGMGIDLIFPEDAANFLEDTKNGQDCSRLQEGQEYLIQKYIENPLLINNKKFDFRMYMFIASMDPFIVLFHPGVIRIAPNDFSTEESQSRGMHLTNTHTVQEDTTLTPEEQLEKKKESILPWEDMNEKLLAQGSVDENWISTLRADSMNFVYHLATMHRDKLLPHPGVFELIGLDFMLDDDLNLWLLEIVPWPGLLVEPELEKARQVLAGVIAPVFLIEYQIYQEEPLDRLIEHEDNMWEVVIDETKEGGGSFAREQAESCKNGKE